jgi:hypothetical protein
VTGDDSGTLANAALALAYFGEDIGAMMGKLNSQLFPLMRAKTVC